MKIVSKFKDYYDFVVMETDNRKVYLRDNRIFSSINSLREEVSNKISNSDLYSEYSNNFYIGVVWFCDTEYRFLHKIDTNEYWYDFFKIPESVLDEAAKEKSASLYHQDMLYHIKQYFMVVYNEKKRIYEVEKSYRVKRKNTKKVNTLCNSPVIYTRRRKHGDEIVLNGSLSDIKFGATKTPSEAYTDIYNFIPFTEVELDSNPTNMNRFESKGFDKKSSFRNIK